MKNTGTEKRKTDNRTIIDTQDGPAEALGGIKIGHTDIAEPNTLRINNITGNLEWYHPIEEVWKEAGAEQGGSTWYTEASDIPSVDFVPIETSNMVVHELYKEVL